MHAYRYHQHPLVAGVCTPVFDKVRVPQVSLAWTVVGAARNVKFVAVGVTEKSMLYLTAVPVAPAGCTADVGAAAVVHVAFVAYVPQVVKRRSINCAVSAKIAWASVRFARRTYC